MDNQLCPNVQKVLDELTPDQIAIAEERHRNLVRGFVDDWQAFYQLKTQVIRDGKLKEVVVMLPERG